MSDETRDRLAVHPKHQARDRFGKLSLQTAHRISRVLAETGAEDDGAVVLNTRGPRPKLADLEKLIDEALAEEEHTASPVVDPDRPGSDSPRPDSAE